MARMQRMQRMHRTIARTNFRPDSEVLAACLDRSVGLKPATPTRVYLREAAEQNFAQLARVVDGSSGLRAAYSVKTNPRNELIDLTLRHGLDVEVISEAEWRHVRARGFEPGRILYNGPRPLVDAQVAVAFADSVEAFERNASRRMELAHGIRVKPTGISSRFGVGIDAIPDIALVAHRSPGIVALGVSFFIRSQDAGRRAWLAIAREIIEDAVLLERLSGKPVTVLDVGGGCCPAEFDDRWSSVFPELLTFAPDRLRWLERVYIEPGQKSRPLLRPS